MIGVFPERVPHSMHAASHFLHHFAELPLVAILRGVTPDEVGPLGACLHETGFRVIEVPLNSPEPLESIRRLAAAWGDRASIGAGTVLEPEQAAAVARAGGSFVVSPNMNPDVIRATKAAGLLSCPGVATPSEGFAALAAGADMLKLFPSEQIAPAVVKAWRAVFPKDLALMPTGGITTENMAAYAAAGVNGFGLGSALYKPGKSVAEVRAAAATFIAAWHACR
jgi:2-dehydro-3-deoxyphosphogalactonate aldolase